MEYQFEGTLTRRDVKLHIPHTFRLPDGATSLELHFSYTPGYVPGGFNALHLSLFDPAGCRGAGHRGGDIRENNVSHSVLLGPATATPGYVAGPLPPGEWSVVIDTHMILPAIACRYRIAVRVVCAPSTDPLPLPTPPAPAPVPAQRGPGWYRGDLHAHTTHSDGHWQIADLLAYARAEQLDFVTLSDHNTIAGLAEFACMARPDLLTIGGIELTTYTGHALALGVRRWIDWRVRPGERSMPQIAAEVESEGGVFIIAHPMSVGDPICTGCDWGYADMLPGPARVVEVWNGGSWRGESNNEKALALWYSWLNQGYRMVATAGTDIHGPLHAPSRTGFNVVYAETLSEAAILEALRQGRLYLSDGPRLELSGRTESGARAMMGGTLPAEVVAVNAAWSGCAEGDRLRLIVDGRPQDEREAQLGGELHWQLEPGQARWCALELRALSGRLRAVTNPLFLASRPVRGRGLMPE